ncbi:hypothetical protein LTR85_004844 [Meristemomyces frigidus]|nr:hypothetical protein LTR85_004844 [Meristemomyces frigidus]
MCALEAASRWALTGTPIQNKLSDIASLYQFLRVYPYHDVGTFQEHIGRLKTSLSDGEALERLKNLIRYIMLRRSIGTVTLPERRDLTCTLDFSQEESLLYEEAKSSALHLIDEALDTDQERVRPELHY